MIVTRSSEAAIRLRDLNPDVSTSENEQVCGCVVQLQRLDVSHRVVPHQFPEGRAPTDDTDIMTISSPLRTRLPPPLRSTSIVLVNEVSTAHDQFGAACLIGIEVKRDFALNHVRFYVCEPPRRRTSTPPVGSDLRRILDHMRDLSAPQSSFLLGRQATAGHEPPTPTSFYDSDLFSARPKYQASSFPPWPLPRMTVSKCSTADIFISVLCARACVRSRDF